MRDVIFCKTRYQDIGYHSYNDLWKLVELAGYPVCYVDEIDAYDVSKTWIVTPLNDEWLNGWVGAKSKIIHLELEWRTDWRANVDTPAGVAETWVCDKSYAERIGARYVPMGSDERLNENLLGSIPYLDMHYISLISYQTPRRQNITQQLKDLAVGISVIDNSWGKDRSRRLRQSVAMLHVHQTPQTAGVAPLRWCLAAAHHLPIISETIPDRGIFGYTHMMMADYEHIAKFTKHMLEDKRLLADYADALHGLLCRDWTFRKMIESSV
jgi:hypothetical protein